MKFHRLLTASALSLLIATAAHATTVGDLTVTDVGTAGTTGNYVLLNNVSVVPGSSVNAPVVQGTSIQGSVLPTALGSNNVGWNPFGSNTNGSQWFSIGGAGGTNSNGGDSSIAFTVTGSQTTFSMIWGSPSVTNTVTLYGAGNTLLGTVTADGNGNLDITSGAATGTLANPSGPASIAYNLSNTSNGGAIIDIASVSPIAEVVLSTAAGQGGFEVGAVSAVPVPGALPLFGSALVGIGALARRRAKRG